MPIYAPIQRAIQVISNKTKTYYHTFCIISVRSGNVDELWRIEKNQTIEVKKGKSFQSLVGSAEFIELVVNTSRNVKDLFSSGLEYAEKHHWYWWRYHAKNGNCQKFVVSLLHSYMNEDQINWIIQDIEVPKWALRGSLVVTDLANMITR